MNVQSTDDVNAYCMPGGKIMVYTGLIEQLHATDAELAAVIGHEIAHALREHSRERISRAYAEQLALAGIAVATGASNTTMQLASQVSAVTFQLPHSREQEAEADRIGLELMARAGYDPNAAISLWQKMGKLARAGRRNSSARTRPGNRESVIWRLLCRGCCRCIRRRRGESRAPTRVGLSRGISPAALPSVTQPLVKARPTKLRSRQRPTARLISRPRR